jgi:[ribosomal protein S18]-alanine N-acetyltransferase
MTPDELADIHRQSFVTPRPWSAAEISDLLESPNVYLLSEPGGFAMIRCAGPEAELLTIAVHPLQRRQRIAARLMDALLETAKIRGVKEMFLEVADGNDPAIALYNASGFSVRATRKSYYTGPDGQKINAIIMARTI